MIENAPVNRYATIDSTNTEARRLFEAGERGPLWLLADEQTGGRGRLSRNWVSKPGNCYSTLLLPLATPLSAASQLGFVVALAVADVVQKYSGAQPQLKWPNDVLVDGAKISGILCEVLSSAPLLLAVGCGINVKHAPEDLPYPATSLAAQGSLAGRDEVFSVYARSLDQWLDVWSGGSGFAAIRQHWLACAIGIGEQVDIAVGSSAIVGRIAGISDTGALTIQTASGAMRDVMAGDLRIPSLQAARQKTA